MEGWLASAATAMGVTMVKVVTVEGVLVVVGPEVEVWAVAALV